MEISSDFPSLVFLACISHGTNCSIFFNFTPCFSILFASSSCCVWYERHKNPPQRQRIEESAWNDIIYGIFDFSFLFHYDWSCFRSHESSFLFAHSTGDMILNFILFESLRLLSNDTDGDLRFFLRRLLRSFPFCFRRCDAMQSEIKWRKSTEERRRRSRGKNQFIYIVSAVELIAVYMCWSRGYVRCNFRRISEKGFIEFGDKFPLEIWVVPASIHTNQWCWIESNQDKCELFWKLADPTQHSSGFVFGPQMQCNQHSF